MVKLITLLAAGIPAVVSAVLAWVARKWGTVAATIVMMVLLTAAFIACINTILNTLVSLLSPPAWLLTAIGMFIPADFGAVFGAMISAKICRAAYDLAFEKAKAFNNAS